MSTQLPMNGPQLTKYQSALVMELVCPYCRKELNEISRTQAHCYPCNAHFYSQEQTC